MRNVNGKVKLTILQLFLIFFFITGWVIQNPAYAGDNDKKAKEKVKEEQTGLSVSDKSEDAKLKALGDFIQSMNKLSEIRTYYPEGDVTAESLRSTYLIPDRVPLLAPHGGTEIIVLAYAAENAIPYLSNKGVVISDRQYKFVQSAHNMTAAYIVFNEEPVLIGNITYAFKAESEGIRVFFIREGTMSLDSAVISKNTSLYVPGSEFLVKGDVIKK